MLEKILEQRLIVLVCTIIFLVLGVLATLTIPIQMIPDLDVRVVQVETVWPGATPQDVEQEILAEQERFLRTLPNISRMTSTARTGFASIELEFPAGTDVTDTLVRVNNALSQVASYPDNVDEPRLEASSFSSNSFIFLKVAPVQDNPRNLDMRRMYDFVDEQVRPLLERVPGVSRVNLGGGSERQIRILVDPAKLAKREMTLTQLRDAIRSRNRNVSAGRLEAGKKRYLIRTLGRFESLEDFGSLVLKSDGRTTVRLSDVAEITASYYRMDQYAIVNGTPAITLSIDRQPGSSVIDIHTQVVATLEDINRHVLNPQGMSIGITSDDVRYVKASIANVWQNLLIGAVMAIVVLYLFLRSGSATIIGVVGIPICAMASFFGLVLFDRTINVMSLAGIAFSLGMTLDNTIVVLEGIDQRRRQGSALIDAIVQSVQQVWPAILASTATTVIVFTPILFVQSEAGQLYSDIAIAISASIIISMLVAVILVPVLSSYLRSQPETSTSQEKLANKAVAVVGWLVANRTRRFAILFGTVLGIVSVTSWLTPPAAYLPEGEEAKTFSMMIAPPGYNLTEMSAIAEQITAAFKPQIQASPADWNAGKTTIPPIKFMIMWVSPERLFVISEPINEQHITDLMDALNSHFRSFPGMRSFASRGSIISSNEGGTRSVNLDISGPDIAALYDVARIAVERAEATFDNPQIGSSPGSLSMDQPFIEVRPNWNRAAELGFSAADIGFSVAALSDGAYIDEFFTNAEKVDIYLYSSAGNYQDVAKLSDLPLFSPAGEVVPLTSVATLRETVGTDAVRRVNGQRTVTLNIVPPRGVALEEAVELVREQIVNAMQATAQIPATVTIDITGASDQLSQTQAQLNQSYLIALILCYCVMVAVFGHWGWPIAILATAPLGIAGGILGLSLLNGFGNIAVSLGFTFAAQPFDMITMLGFLILLGLVVNNPILIIHRTLSNLDAGSAIQPAVLSAVASRIRPITMSLLTTLVGLAPLVFLPGAGTELYRGVGAVVLFGLLFATILSVTFLPVLLVTVGELKERAQGRATQRSTQP